MDRIDEMLEVLVCPRDKCPLGLKHDALVCSEGHSCPVIDGVPILLIGEIDQTHIEGNQISANSKHARHLITSPL